MDASSSRDICHIVETTSHGSQTAARTRYCGEVSCEFDNAAGSSERSASMRKLFIAVAMCAVFMIVEVIGGIKANSLAILTDAAHLLSDVAAFAISLFSLWAAFAISQRKRVPTMNTSLVSLLVVLVTTGLVAGDCTCEANSISHDTILVILKYKIGAIVAILASSAVGVFLPIVGKNISMFHPESIIFLLLKSFAAGVILSTGFIHILPEALEALTSPCLKEKPWGSFPFAGLAAMAGSLGSLGIDAFANGYFRRVHSESRHVNVDEEASGEHAGHVHLHTHATHRSPQGLGLSDLDRLKYKVTSQVLELGIIVHSVIIGISMGSSQSLSTIKPLVAALCFHQMFEGIGLGGCIAQATFKTKSAITIRLFFSLTTPIGIAIGIGIMNVYDENSPTALIVQGLLDACAAGILVYMALVDLLAHDFMSPKLQSTSKLFLGASISVLLGAGLMALLAILA